MPTVKCVTMQRDEALLLEPWLRYHGYLFGFDNLVVIDNGSMLPDVLATLRRYELVGVRVFRQFGMPTHYERKGPLTADVIRILDHQTSYDFVVPLDCDEFVALWLDDRVTCDRRDILDYLARLDAEQLYFRIDNCLYNDPSRAGWYWPQGALKGFLRSRSIQSLDHGYHTFSEGRDSPMADCDLTHLHFHHKPFEMMRAHARWKLETLVDVDDPIALRAFRGPGVHLIRNLMSTEVEYYRQFDDHLTFHFPGFSALMAALGVDNAMMTLPDPRPMVAGQVVIRQPRNTAAEISQERGETMVLSPLKYRDANFDVGVAGVNPLRHFLFVGFKESRPLV